MKYPLYSSLLLALPVALVASEAFRDRESLLKDNKAWYLTGIPIFTLFRQVTKMLLRMLVAIHLAFIPRIDLRKVGKPEFDRICSGGALGLNTGNTHRWHRPAGP